MESKVAAEGWPDEALLLLWSTKLDQEVPVNEMKFMAFHLSFSVHIKKPQTNLIFSWQAD